MRNYLGLLSNNNTIEICKSYNNGELEHKYTEIRDDEYLFNQVLDIAGLSNEAHIVKEIKNPFYELILTEPPMGGYLFE